jgi:hypothetical protein
MFDVDVPERWRREQLERARAVAEFDPNPAAVAEEARDLRP